MRNAYRPALAVTAAAALFLAACGDGGEGSPGADGGSGETLEISPEGDQNVTDYEDVADGGELTLAIAEAAEQQNVFHADMTAYSRDVWNWYNPQLLLAEGDGTTYPNPEYITNIDDELVDGKTVVTYDLNEDAEFNDGTPIDIEAFQATWRANNGEDEAYTVNSTEGWSEVESVEAGDSDKQVVVTFKRAYPWWAALYGSVLHPEAAEPENFSEAYVRQLRPEWGAGPFKVDSADFNSGTFTFVRNEKWWGREARLEKVTLRQLEDQASINAFRAGEIDATGVATKDRLAQAREMGDEIELRTSTRAFVALITLNSEALGLDDVRVREAVARAIDRSQLAEIRYNGLEYEEELPGSLIWYPFQDEYKDNYTEAGGFDAEKSKKILDEAGWEEGSDGVREKDGEKRSLRYVSIGDDPNTKATAQAVQQLLRDVGVDVKIEERPAADFSKVANERDFDIFPMGFSASDPFGVAYIGQIYRSDSQLNRSGVNSEEIDAAIAELVELPTAEEQTEAGHEIEKEALEQYGLIPFANGPIITALKPGLANFGPSSFAVLPRETIGWEKDAAN
ncbi:ABC transporter family substrate-binding protein [Corynebacterium otitidis]